MTFITLDNKDWCKGVYHNGELHFDKLPDNLTKTWKYAPYLKEQTVEYASLYAQGKTITDICPEDLKNQWLQQKARLSAFHSSFVEAKVCLEDNCFFDLVPKQFLLEICETKVKIIDRFLESNQKPENYDLLLQTEKIITDISDRSLNLDLEFLKSNIHNSRARMLLSKARNTKKVV